jgi:hypothetical protein
MHIIPGNDYFGFWAENICCTQCVKNLRSMRTMVRLEQISPRDPLPKAPIIGGTQTLELTTRISSRRPY